MVSTSMSSRSMLVLRRMSRCASSSPSGTPSNPSHAATSIAVPASQPRPGAGDLRVCRRRLERHSAYPCAHGMDFFKLRRRCLAPIKPKSPTGTPHASTTLVPHDTQTTFLSNRPRVRSHSRPQFPLHCDKRRIKIGLLF